MVNSSQDEERYSRMHSLVIWLSPLVGRRAIYLFSVVISAFAGGGRYGVVSSGSGTLDGTLLDSAEDTTHFVVFFPHEQFDIRVARARNWTTSLGKHKLLPFPMALRKAFRKTRFAIRAVQPENLHVCDACFRFLPDMTPWCGGVSRF